MTYKPSNPYIISSLPPVPTDKPAIQTHPPINCNGTPLGNRLCNNPSVHSGDCSVYYETDSLGNTYLCANDHNSALQKDPTTRINGQFRCKRGVLCSA